MEINGNVDNIDFFTVLLSINTEIHYHTTTARTLFMTAAARGNFTKIEIVPPAAVATDLFICPRVRDTAKAVCEYCPYIGLTVGPSIFRVGGRRYG